MKVPKLSRNQHIQLALVEHPQSVMRVADELIDLWDKQLTRTVPPDW